VPAVAAVISLGCVWAGISYTWKGLPSVRIFLLWFSYLTLFGSRWPFPCRYSPALLSFSFILFVAVAIVS
jgi:hypothetical protein